MDSRQASRMAVVVIAAVTKLPKLLAATVVAAMLARALSAGRLTQTDLGSRLLICNSAHQPDLVTGLLIFAAVRDVDGHGPCSAVMRSGPTPSCGPISRAASLTIRGAVRGN
jgi:hypothetical protein